MLESQRLPEPLVTPSTKAEQGEHDENISPKEGTQNPCFNATIDLCYLAERIIGAELYSRVAAIALKLYATAAEYAISRGLVLADTKFEFGLISPSNPSEEEVILVDEVLTPDSSRYWPLDKYEPGKSQPNFDKQYVRDWLVSQGYRRGLEKGPEGTDKGWDIDADVIEGTQRRYLDVENMLKREEPVA